MARVACMLENEFTMLHRRIGGPQRSDNRFTAPD
jgi:hypothetical protein